MYTFFSECLLAVWADSMLFVGLKPFRGLGKRLVMQTQGPDLWHPHKKLGTAVACLRCGKHMYLSVNTHTTTLSKSY